MSYSEDIKALAAVGAAQNLGDDERAKAISLLNKILDLMENQIEHEKQEMNKYLAQKQGLIGGFTTPNDTGAGVMNYKTY